jgi:hypothetical protein
MCSRGSEGIGNPQICYRGKEGIDYPTEQFAKGCWIISRDIWKRVSPLTSKWQPFCNKSEKPKISNKNIHN